MIVDAILQAIHIPETRFPNQASLAVNQMSFVVLVVSQCIGKAKCRAPLCEPPSNNDKLFQIISSERRSRRI